MTLALILFVLVGLPAAGTAGSAGGLLARPPPPRAKATDPNRAKAMGPSQARAARSSCAAGLGGSIRGRAGDDPDPPLIGAYMGATLLRAVRG